MIDSPHWSSRDPALKAARNGKMARSAHAYVRGNTLQFYEWLDSISDGSLPTGQPIWICGDCHLGNLGPIADAEGKVEIQIRDFDQTVIGNPAHDLIRLGLSLAVAARGSDLPGVTTARILEHLIDGYTHEFVADSEHVSPERPDVVYQSLRQAARRSWRHLAAERLEGATTKFPIGRRFWAVSKPERRAIEELFQEREMHRVATLLSHRPDDGKVKLVDAAYWMKGCSSLGLLRYAVLLDVGGKAASARDLCLIDIKEATKAIAPRASDAKMPRDNAKRVLEGARQMSPALGERMVATRLLDRSVFIRELLPEDLKLEMERITSEEAVLSARYLSRVVGRAHARQMDSTGRKLWKNELERNRLKTLDAPSWLWSSVVDLVATHERGYLDHCRRYAMDTTP